MCINHKLIHISPAVYACMRVCVYVCVWGGVQVSRILLPITTTTSSNLNVSSNCLLDSMISDYKIAVNLNQVFVCDESLILLLSGLYLCFWLSIISDVSRGGWFGDYCTGVHRASWMCRLILFIKFGKLSAIIFKYFFCLF